LSQPAPPGWCGADNPAKQLREVRLIGEIAIPDYAFRMFGARMMIDLADVAYYAYSWSAHTFVCSEYSERAAFPRAKRLAIKALADSVRRKQAPPKAADS
jgi:hypothetical protein